jgi:hypothetical protein
MTRGPEHPRVEAKTFCVRDVEDPDLGIKRFHAAKDASELEIRGVGHTFADATDEIEDGIDLKEHVGEVVATVCVDFDESKAAYTIDWHVEPDEGATLASKVREVLRL